MIQEASKFSQLFRTCLGMAAEKKLNREKSCVHIVRNFFSAMEEIHRGTIHQHQRYCANGATEWRDNYAF